MSRHLAAVLALCALGSSTGCSSLPPPRPLAAGEVYWCCPGSAIPRRVALGDGMDLPGARSGVHRRSRCGSF